MSTRSSEWTGAIGLKTHTKNWNPGWFHWHFLVDQQSHPETAPSQLPLEEINIRVPFLLLWLIFQMLHGPLNLYHRFHLVLQPMALHVSIPAFYLVKHSRCKREIKARVFQYSGEMLQQCESDARRIPVSVQQEEYDLPPDKGWGFLSRLAMGTKGGDRHEPCPKCHSKPTIKREGGWGQIYG